MSKKLKEIAKAAVFVVMFGGLVILGAFSFGMSTYSAAPAAFYSGESVFVTGYVEYENGTVARGVSIDLFATDGLLHDIVTTNDEGRFYSMVKFESGQIMRVDILEQRFTRFIDYFVEGGTFNLGTFIILGG